MNLSEICIKRPVLTIVISLVLILMGYMGYRQLEIRSAPKVFTPHLRITIEAAGSSAEFIEKNAVTPLEERLQDVPDISYIHSSATQDFGVIHLNFKSLSKEQFLSAQTQVMQIINSVEMPQAVQKVRMHQGYDSTQLMFASVSSSTMNQQALVDYVHNVVIKQLSQLPGVGNVFQDSTSNALRISLDPAKLAQYQLSPETVINAINENNIAQPAGQVVNSQLTIPINLNSRLNSIQAFQDMIVSKINHHEVHLADIANIAIEHQSFAGAFTYYNGKQGVGLEIFANDGANPISTGQLLQKKIQQLNQQMPPGTKINVMFNGGKLIHESVNEVFWTIFESIALVALITFLFLGKCRFTLIPLVTIPVCMIATFAVMWLLGFSLNLISLLALVLGVGLVVDDAIVVLENCHRFIENGYAPKEAALKSLKQITFPVIAMTISLFAVYLPSAFLSGKTAIYIQQFAFTLAGSVIISGFVALTLTPMMCSRLLTHVQPKGYDKFLLQFFSGLSKAYANTLQWVLNHRIYIIIIFILCLIVGVFTFKSMSNELLPNEYAGYLIASINAPNSASVAYTESIEQHFLKSLLKQPTVEHVMSFGGGDGNSSSNAINIIQLKSGYRSAKQTIAVANALEAKYQSITGAQIYVIPLNVGIGNDNNNSDQQQEGSLLFDIVGDARYPVLSHSISELATALKKTGLFNDVQNEVKLNSQQFQININRELAAQLNVPVNNITNSISTLLGGYEINDGYQFNGVSYPVIVQLPENNVKDLSVLRHIFVNSNDGLQIPLSRLVTVKNILSLNRRTHMNGIREGQIMLVPKTNVALGQVVTALETHAKRILPSSLNVQFTEQVLHLIQGNDTLDILFILGLVFIYLILSALYESFMDPFIILLTVPLCVVGAIVILKLTGGTLNLYTGIGLITLIGLVSKHGVLIVQFANSMLPDTKDAKQAVKKAACIRLRPILMTTATMTIGAVPLLFFNNIGSNGRGQLATVIIAGLLFGTFFSLFVVPVAYSLFKRLQSTILVQE